MPLRNFRLRLEEDFPRPIDPYRSIASAFFENNFHGRGFLDGRIKGFYPRGWGLVGVVWLDHRISQRVAARDQVCSSSSD